MHAPRTEPLIPREEPTRSSRRMAASRALWIATRARNASRRAWRITIVGAVAVIATLLVLVLVPREADRTLREQLERIPPPLDTVSLAQQLGAVTTRERAQRHADSLRIATRARVAAAGVRLAVDTLDRDLAQRIARAQEVPLAESYLALAESPALRGDVRAHAIADSIEAVDREREAYAALGGADARYAALTSRLAMLGQRLVRIAQSHGGGVRSAGSDSDGTAPRESSATQSADTNVRANPATSVLTNPATNSATNTATNTATKSATSVAVAKGDSTSTLRTLLADSGARTRQQLAAVRLTNAALELRRENVRAQLNVSVPPFAMLLAALVVGLSVGYGVQVLRELRRPTVGDEAEVERMTNARVVVQRAVSGARAASVVKRRGDVALPAIISATELSYPLLHFALTGIGDVAHAVEVVAEQPRLATIVALNVATVAARESRTTLVVEDAAVAHLFEALLRQPKKATAALNDVASEVASLSSVHSIVLERDLTIDVLSARTPVDARLRVMDRYDLTLLPSGADSPGELVESSAEDVVICVRLAATPLNWLTAVTQRAGARRQRIRAVLLWVNELPTG